MKITAWVDNDSGDHLPPRYSATVVLDTTAGQRHATLPIGDALWLHVEAQYDVAAWRELDNFLARYERHDVETVPVALVRELLHQLNPADVVAHPATPDVVDEVRCPSIYPEGSRYVRCDRARGHDGPHAVQQEDGLETWR